MLGQPFPRAAARARPPSRVVRPSGESSSERPPILLLSPASLALPLPSALSQVNCYAAGEWLPPHVDSRAFARPFAVVSLDAGEVVFGPSLAGDGKGGVLRDDDDDGGGGGSDGDGGGDDA